MAYVDCDAKPPRNVARKQAKFGTGMALSMTNAVQKNSSIKPVTRPSLNSNAGSTAEPVPPPPPPPAVQQKGSRSAY